MDATVTALYMTMPDPMRKGHRMKVDDFECDPEGIIGDIGYQKGEGLLLLVCEKSYRLIEEAELVLDRGVLMENILVDADIYHLPKGSIIEIGEALFEVQGPCEFYGYLPALAPELPEILAGNRGLFIKALDHDRVSLGDRLNIIKTPQG